MQQWISYIKTVDIAYAFCCLMVEWIEAYTDFDELISKSK